MKNEIIACLIIAFVTLMTRALPFIITGKKKADSHFLQRLSQLLTPALIGMLVVYCLKDISFANTTGISALIAGTICVLSYIWKRNTLISIVIPTIIYMVLIQML
ncbi:MAG: AzlD domain-containing protein [Sphaerochaetaceae bacterium]|nr:AzlD domain-containing protein [Sphaerochaetaceae bacterium]